MPTPLLERDEERRALGELIERASAGAGGAVLLEGPAGIGKTRLVQEALALGARAGCACLHARGSELERDFAFGLVRQLFEGPLARLEDERRDELFEGAAVRAAPIFATVAPTERAEPEAESGLPTLHGLHWLVANMAERQPLLLAVDDAHWADAPSLRWLAYLANRLDGLPVAVVVAMRPEEPGAEKELLDRIAAHPLTHALSPAPLSEAAVRAFAENALGAEPDPEFVAACLDTTRGNPFFLDELLRALAGEGLEPTAAGAGRLIELAPPTVARSVLRRLGGLSPDVLRLAQAVAVLGDGAGAVGAAALAGLDRAAASAAAETLSRASILDVERLVFIHPVVRAVVYADIGAPERARMHTEAARILSEASADADAVALHVLAGDPAASEPAVAVLREAAARASNRGAPDVAATYLHRALAEPPPESARTPILWELGRAEVAARGTDGIAYLREAFEAADAPVERAEICLELGRAMFTQALFSSAAEALEMGIAEVEGRDERLVHELRGQLASIALLDFEVRERMGGLAAIAEAIEAPATGDPSYQATLAWIQVASDPPADTGADLAARALAHGHLSPYDDAVVFGGAVTALAAAGRLREAREAWDGVVADSRRSGSVSTLGFALVLRAAVMLRLGDLPAAEADAREVIELALEPGLPVVEDRRVSAPWVVAPLIDALLERGELEQAGQLFDLSGIGDDMPGLLQFNYLLDSLGRLRLAQGRHVEAVAHLREAGRRQTEWGIGNPGFLPWRSGLALALAASGEREEALALCGEQAELARSFGVSRELGMALRAGGLVAGGDEGVEALREATAVLEPSGAELEHARALVDLGAALRRLGHRADARDPLRRGLDLARRCAATPLAARAHEELVASGAKPRRLALSGVESLTASELRVARMAAGGLTNREIAQALFVTEKTVEGHLGNTYRKLDISSRSQLPGALAPS